MFLPNAFHFLVGNVSACQLNVGSFDLALKIEYILLRISHNPIFNGGGDWFRPPQVFPQ